MRKLFLVLFLFTLSSSHRLYRRSEDVDPLLKELFSETKDPSPKDRRDGQTSGDDHAGSGSGDDDDHAGLMDDASKSSGSGESDNVPDEDDNSGSNSSDLPSGSNSSDLPSESKSSDLSSESNPSDLSSESKSSDLPSESNSSDLPSESKSSDLPSESKSSDLPSESKSSDLPSESKSSDLPSESKSSDLPSESKSSDLPSESKSSDLPSESKSSDLPSESKSSDLPSESNPPKQADAPASKKDDASASEAKETGADSEDVTKPDSDEDEDEDDKSSGSGSEDDSPDVKEDVKPKPSLTSADEIIDKPAEADAKETPALASQELAAVKDEAANDKKDSDVTDSDNQSDEKSESASAVETPAVPTNVLPAEKQEAAIPSNESADVNTDVNQSTASPSMVESPKDNVPEAPAVLANTENSLQQQSSDVPVVPEAAPASAAQPSWPAVNPLPLVAESGNQRTNENPEFFKKDSIPAAPRQPGASSSPLQLNKHSPGAELIKRFFIAKQQAKKKKEEDAAEKSLIGDGRYTVSSNNGYYNYAAAPQAPPLNPNALQENGNRGICVDKYDSCPEFARNHYCTDYKQLMKVQCQKSCKFCDGDDEDDDDDDDDNDDHPVKTDQSNSKDGDEDDDDEDEDRDKKTDLKNKKKDSKKDDGIAKDSDDDDDDDDDFTGDTPLFSDKSSETGSGEEASGLSSGSGEKFEDINESSSGNGSVAKADGDLPPTADELEVDDEDEDEKADASGSGKDEDDSDNDDDELVKELSQQALYNEQNVKKDTIPSAPGPPSAYPKIDLKDIARYVTLYRSVAKKLFGEALDSAKKEFVAQQSKKSDIPVPIKQELRSSKDSSDSLEGFYSSQDTKRNNIPMNPNNAEFTPNDEDWANKAYKEAETYLRSKIPEFKNYAPPAMFNYPFYINDPNKTEGDTNEGTNSKKSDIPTPNDPQQKYNKTLQDILRKDHVSKPSSDPYEYLRNMIPGSSMKPIASKNGIMYVQDTYSRPIQLNTKSQWLDMVAKKKSAIPKAPQQAEARSQVKKPAVASVPQIQTKPEALAAQVAQYKSEVPQPEGITTFSDSQQSPQQLQQLPSTEDANFLQSNGNVDQSTNFESVDPRSKAVSESEAVTPLTRLVRHAHHKVSKH